MDEQNVYVVAPSKTTDSVFVTVYKIVNGARIQMGAAEYQYDDRARRLTYEFTAGTIHGRWELVVSGASMDGTLTLLPDKTVVRRATLKKSAP